MTCIHQPSYLQNFYYISTCYKTISKLHLVIRIFYLRFTCTIFSRTILRFLCIFIIFYTYTFLWFCFLITTIFQAQTWYLKCCLGTLRYRIISYRIIIELLWFNTMHKLFFERFSYNSFTYLLLIIHSKSIT